MTACMHGNENRPGSMSMDLQISCEHSQSLLKNFVQSNLIFWSGGESGRVCTNMNSNVMFRYKPKRGQAVLASQKNLPTASEATFSVFGITPSSSNRRKSLVKVKRASVFETTEHSSPIVGNSKKREFIKTVQTILQACALLTELHLIFC